MVLFKIIIGDIMKNNTLKKLKESAEEINSIWEKMSKEDIELIRHNWHGLVAKNYIEALLDVEKDFKTISLFLNRTIDILKIENLNKTLQNENNPK